MPVPMDRPVRHRTTKMSVTNYEVRHVERRAIAAFIEQWHYSGSINGCIADYCFSLHDGERMIGAMFYGRMAMAGQWKRFAERESDVTELRRTGLWLATRTRSMGIRERFTAPATSRWKVSEPGQG